MKEGEPAVPRRQEPRRPRIRQPWVRFPAHRVPGASRASKKHVLDKVPGVPREETRVRTAKRGRKPIRIVVLLSAEGSELQALVSELDRATVEGEIVAVITDNADADGIGFAVRRGIRTVVFDPARFVDTAALTKEVEDVLNRINPDVVLLDDFPHPIKLPLGRIRHVVDRADTVLKVATFG